MNPSDFEPVDNTPVEIPTRLRLPQSRTDQIRQFIREELSRSALSNQHESFEEADDLEPDGEEYMPYSQYELADLEPPEPPEKPGEREAQGPVNPAPTSEVPPVSSSEET